MPNHVHPPINPSIPKQDHGSQANKSHRYQRIIGRFETAALANIGTQVRIGDLCRIAGVNQRTLLRAVRDVHHKTASQFLREVRLSQARRTLLSADPVVQSVTEIALRFGFGELGRFAVDYRTKFGESPSETLRRKVANAENAC